jgi:hypothetical protein
MNINLTTATIATSFALLFAGATACGSEDGTASTPARHAQPAAQIHQAGQPLSADLIEKAKQHAYRQLLRAQRAQAARPSGGFGDDRRQSIEQSRSNRAATGQHAPGYDNGLFSEW